MYSEIEHAIDSGGPADILEAVGALLERHGCHGVARGLRMAAEMAEHDRELRERIENEIGPPDDDLFSHAAAVAERTIEGTLEDAARKAEAFESHGVTYDDALTLLTRLDWHGVPLARLTQALPETQAAKARFKAWIDGRVDFS